MAYLKVVNCPIRGLFPEKAKRAIDWVKAGFNVTQVSRFSSQGKIAVDNDDFVSVLPIDDEAKLSSCMSFENPEATIIDEVNGNANAADTAEIITDEAAQAVKDAIQAVRDAQ